MLVSFRAGTTPSQANAGSAYDLIAAVNQLRQANGLPAYEINGALMAAAQAHSEYQASIGTITHTGSGGSTAKSRAIAAGYGGGATVYVSENIAGGTSMTYQVAVQMWQGDSLHLNTMLGGSYTDVGAGVATSGNSVYFTLDVGYVAGAAGTGSTTTGTTSSSSSPTGPTAIPYQPLITATAAADGSVTHTVASGQTLWVISALYDVALPEIMELNNFTDTTLIFPGEQILIRPASVTPSPIPSETKAPETPTATNPPVLTATPAAPDPAPLTAEAEIDLERAAAQKSTPARHYDPVLIIIAGFVSVGTFLIILGNVLKRRT